MACPDLTIFVATSGHSGVDRVMRNLVPGLAGLGVKIDVLRIEGHGPHWDSLPDEVRLISLGTSHVGTALLPLIRYLRRERPRVLLTDKDRVNRLALWARRLARVPTRVCIRLGTTVSVNLTSRPVWDRWVQTQSMRRFYGWADCILVPSQGAAVDLARFAGIAEERIHVVASPVITPQFQALAAQEPEHPWFRDNGPPIILGVGELSARKDFATLVSAFALLRRHRDCRLVIFGEGRRREQLERLAQELDVAPYLALPGFVANPYPYMARAAVFALPSRWEGMPVVLIEALGLGTPVVATDCPSGPRELLDEGRHGRLVAVGDAEALARALEDTLDHPPEPAALRQAAQRYTVDNSAREYLRALGLDGAGL